MRFLLALIVGSCFLPTPQVSAQQPPQSISFHVTSVKTQNEPPDDWCTTTGRCRSVKFTVEGYARDQRLVLTCLEVTVFEPTLHRANACARLQVNTNYDATLWPDLILQFPLPSDTVPQTVFNVASQKK